MRMGNDAAHHELDFHHLEREGEREAQNPSYSLSGLLTNDTASPPLDLTQGIAGCSQAILALHLPAQLESLPTLSYQLLMLLPGDETLHSLPTAREMESSGEQDTAG